MIATQKHLPIQDIKEGIVLLKDGGSALILQTNAVNFGLLSENEQLAIIFSFGQLLNSLSFSIQIVIRSKRLDISLYLDILDRARQLQTNPLLARLMVDYRQFVQTTIKEQEVLDKSFYIIIPLSSLEMGLKFGDGKERFKKAQTILEPRRDQLVKQLGRVGLKTTQLDSKKLIELFFDIYNPSFKESSAAFVSSTPVNLRESPPKVVPPYPLQPTIPPPFPQTPIIETRTSKTHPFVVEELADTI